MQGSLGPWQAVPSSPELIMSQNIAPSLRRPGMFWGYRVLRASEGGPRVSSPRSAARSGVPEGPEKWKLCQQGDSFLKEGRRAFQAPAVAADKGAEMRTGGHVGRGHATSERLDGASGTPSLGSSGCRAGPGAHCKGEAGPAPQQFRHCLAMGGEGQGGCGEQQGAMGTGRMLW